MTASQISTTVNGGGGGSGSRVGARDTGCSSSAGPVISSALYMWGYNESGQAAAGRAGDGSGQLVVRKCLRVPRLVPPTLLRHRQPQPPLYSQHISPEQQQDTASATSNVNNKINNCDLRKGSHHIRIVDIACGLQHTAAVASNGSLFTWGSNEFGQLGDGTEDSCAEPKRVKALDKEFVKSVACGANCTAAITGPRKVSQDDSPPTRLWVWGQNQGSNYPQLFFGAFTQALAVVQVACGASHVAALSELGTMQCWGYNEYGQLGRGFSCEGRQEARIVDKFVKFLDEPPEDVQISQIACGDNHTAAVSVTGDLYTWGLGHMGQLGHRTLQSPEKEVLPRRVVSLEGVKITDIACGGVHTCALSEFGALYMWGGGQAGQLGIGPQSDAFSCYSNDLTLFSRHLPMLLVPSGVQHVTCGQCHTLAAMSDGRVLGWGYNSCGQAATGKSPYAWYPSPIDWCVGEVRRLAAGGGHSAILTQACSLKELCELKLAESVTPENSQKIEEIAARNHADALVRFCEKVRSSGGAEYD